MGRGSDGYSHDSAPGIAAAGDRACTLFGVALEHKYDDRRRLLWLTASGALSLRDFEGLDLREVPNDVVVLLDGRGVEEVDLTGDEVRLLAHREVQGELDRVIRMAILTGTTVAYGLGRMFEMLAADALYETAVFTELERALAWLGVPPDA